MADNQGKLPTTPTPAKPDLILPAKDQRNYITLSETGNEKIEDKPEIDNRDGQLKTTPTLPPPNKRIYLNQDKQEINSEISGQDETQQDDLEKTAPITSEPLAKPEKIIAAKDSGKDNRQKPKLPPTQEITPASAAADIAQNKKLAAAAAHRELRNLAQNGKYKLEQMLARGAESVLYKASCNGRTVCVKAVRNTINRWVGDAMTRNQEERLEKVNYRTKLRHIRNEFRVSEIFYSDEEIPAVHIYALRPVNFLGLELGCDLIMEYLQGHDLGDKILARTLTLADKINVFYRAVQAVSFLHKRNLIHLDIKPSNFMLVRDQVKLIDFGVSVGTGYRPRAITGTAGYLSPEQICREPLDEGTDIFALGVAFSVFFGGRSLNQSQDTLLRRQTRLDAHYHLNNDTQPMINEAPDLHTVPPIFEVLRNCTIPKRDARINKCETLLHLLRQKAEQIGIELSD